MTPQWALRNRHQPALIARDVPSQILKAGRRPDLHPRPADFEEIAACAAGRSAG